MHLKDLNSQRNLRNTERHKIGLQTKRTASKMSDVHFADYLNNCIDDTFVEHYCVVVSFLCENVWLQNGLSI